MSRIPLGLFILSIIIFSCSSGEENNSFNSDIDVRWEVFNNSSGADSARFTLINRGEEALGNNWNIYFNQIGGSPNSDFENKNAEIVRVGGYFFKLQPGEDLRPLLPGDILELTYGLPGPVARKSFTPQGMYYIIEGQEPVEVSDESIVYYVDELPPSLKGLSPGERFEINRNVSLLDESDLLPVIPSPVTLKFGRDTLSLDTIKIAYPNEISNEADQLGMRLSKFFSGPIMLRPDDPGAHIRLSIDQSMSKEGAYELKVTDTIIEIIAGSASGIFYGIQSLTSLLILPENLKIQQLKIREVEVRDAPRFSYRGLHIDMARNFKSKEALLKVIDIMAFYKLNKLNLQLADDEGWRLEIPSLPELHEVGGSRGHTIDERDHLHPAYGSGPDPGQNRGGTGWYSRDDFIDILRYAWDRHIEVIPKLDFPGHARAAIKAMESRYYRLKEEGVSEEFASNYLLSDLEDKSQYRSVQGYDDNVICVCRESVYDFLEVVVDDIMAMYNEANVPVKMFHLGGDEVPTGVWVKSPECTSLIRDNDWDQPKVGLSAYFVEKVNDILSRRGLITSAWEEFASEESESGLVPNPDFVDSRLIPFVWHKEYAYPLANAGYNIIICNSNSLYFDLAYEQDVYEPGLTWAGYVGMRQPFDLDPLRLEVDYQLSRPGNILGLQAQLWGETIWDDERLEYYLLPKLFSFAERAWSIEPEWAATEGNQRDRQYRKNWNRFSNTVALKELPRLVMLKDKITVRLPRPGAVIREGILYANSEMPGLKIRFTTDGTEPTLNSELYTEPEEINVETREIRLKTFFKDNRSFTTIVKLSDEKGN